MPAVVLVPLQPYQIQFGFGGQIFGQGSNGVYLQGIPSGLRDLSPIRGGDVDLTMENGTLAGLDFTGGKTVQVNWELTLSPVGVETSLAALAAQHAIVSDPSVVSMTAADYLVHQVPGAVSKPVSVMLVQLPGRTTPFLVFGRPTRFTAPIDEDYQYGRVSPKSEWSVPDGLVYDGAVVSGTCGLPNPTSGVGFPAGFPLAFGASAGGSFGLTNAGNAPSPAVFTITGPCMTPTITNTATGAYIALNITLGAGDTLVIDTKAQVVTLNGTANRNNTVVIGTKFFKIVPGLNTIQFSTRDPIAVAAQLTGYTLSAYSVA
jgi:hypothetical protein